jgi:hypothetical protein
VSLLGGVSLRAVRCALCAVTGSTLAPLMVASLSICQPGMAVASLACSLSTNAAVLISPATNSDIIIITLTYFLLLLLLI